jgi:hypothetical protein
MAESKSLGEIKTYTSSSTHFIYLATKSTSQDPSSQDALARCIKKGQEANAKLLITKLASIRTQLATTVSTINEAPFERTIWSAEKQVDIEVIERELRAYLGVVKGFTTDKVVQEGSSAGAEGDQKKNATDNGEEGKAEEDSAQSTADVSFCCSKMEDVSLVRDFPPNPEPEP